MPRIDELWAWVSSDKEGEGILAAPLQKGMLSIPLVGADRDRMLSYAPIARRMAKAFGVEIKLVRFTTRVDVESITPAVTSVDLPPMPADLPDKMRKVVSDELAKQTRGAARKEHDEHPE